MRWCSSPNYADFRRSGSIRRCDSRRSAPTQFPSWLLREEFREETSISALREGFRRDLELRERFAELDRFDDFLFCAIFPLVACY